MATSVECAVIFGDPHIGSKTGLCPPTVGIDYDCGFHASPAQLFMWERWETFWKEVVPWATRRRPYVVINGGDTLEGVHHRSTAAVTNALAWQAEMAVKILRPYIDKAAAYYQIAGTGAHDGENWAEAEFIARQLGSPARADSAREHVHPDVKIQLGDAILHDTHHQTVNSLHRTALGGIHSELVEQAIDAAFAAYDCPTCVVRHHAHEYGHVERFFRNGVYGHGVKVPSWQLKGQYPWKTGARNKTPHWGAVVICWDPVKWSGGGELRINPFTFTRDPSRPIVIEAPAKRRRR